MEQRLKYIFGLKKLKRAMLYLTFLGTTILFSAACQQSSDDDSGSSGGGSDTTAPTTTISSSDCTVNSLNLSCTTTSATVTVTADETATIYYETANGSTPSTPTVSSSSISSGGSVNISGSEGDTWYVSYIAVDSNGNTSSTTTVTVGLLTAPSSSLVVNSTSVVNFVSNYCSYIDTSADARTYSCIGEVSVTVQADSTANGETIFYSAAVDSTSDTPTDHGDESADINVTSNNTYIKFYAQTSAGKAESTKTYLFQINGVVPNDSGNSQVQSGYYNTQKTFELSLVNDDRNIHDFYQIHYNSSSDASTDTASIYDSTPQPNVVSPPTRYYSTGFGVKDELEETLEPSFISGSTTIYQYKFNMIYNSNGDPSGDYPSSGSTDAETSLVLYFDGDKPKTALLPPSSGSLDDSITIKTFVHDNGHELVERYRKTNSSLPGFGDSTNTNLPLSDATQDSDKYPHAWYCSAGSSYTSDSCDQDSEKTTFASQVSIDVSSDSYFILRASDKAGNDSTCDSNTATNQISDCHKSASVSAYHNHYIYYYTPGMQESRLYSTDHFKEANDPIRNFGHSVLVADIDGSGGDNDIIIGAPDYDSLDSTEDGYGAVYIWYNGFNERAMLTFSISDSSVDITDKYMDVSTDGNATLRIYLDPSTDTSSYGGSIYQTFVSPDSSTTPYSNYPLATPSELSNVLNAAFQSSIGQSYRNHLYADASGDTQLTIGHLNKDIQGYFNYSSNFDITADLYRSSGSTIRAYDYKIYGEADDSEFGYSLAFGVVDNSADSGYSTSNLVVGAPGYASDNGALYVIKLPATEASADYSEVSLSTNKSDVHSIYTSSSGRLGTAIALLDASNDGQSYKNIYVSAPYYYNATYALSNAGAVYEVPYQNFAYDNTSDISDSTNDVAIWAGEKRNGFNLDDQTAANGLFGFSLIGGLTQIQSDNTKPTLYIGVPGDSTTEGRVRYVDLETWPLNQQADHETQLPDTSANGDLFGYSLAIVSRKIDSATSLTCPCLVVGSPGHNLSMGQVWMFGASFQGSIEGEEQGDDFGISLAAGTMGESDSSSSYLKSPTIVIGAKDSDDEGQLKIIRPQTLVGGVDVFPLTAESTSFIGSNSNELMGNSIGIITINSDGDVGVLVGFAGKDATYMGGVRVYSPSKLLSN